MINQLPFEPRRLRVYAAKAGAVVVGGLLLALAVGAVWWLAVAGAASARNRPVLDGITGEVGWQVVRGAVLVAGAGSPAWPPRCSSSAPSRPSALPPRHPLNRCPECELGALRARRRVTT